MDGMLKLNKVSEGILPILHEWFNSAEAAGEFDAAVKQSLKKLQKRFAYGHYESLRVVMFEEKPIGWTDIRIFPDSPTSAGITVQISKPEYRGKGLGLRIHQLALSEFIKENKNVRYVEAWTHVNNIAEQRILEKLNFKRDPKTIKQFAINEQMADFYTYELELPK
jgi:RimJ/RimL family protein N-acetyltransferase